jgi:hypothetical protein
MMGRARSIAEFALAALCPRSEPEVAMFDWGMDGRPLDLKRLFRFSAVRAWALVAAATGASLADHARILSVCRFRFGIKATWKCTGV